MSAVTFRHPTPTLGPIVPVCEEFWASGRAVRRARIPACTGVHPTVSTWGPPTVTATVCSWCAARLPSALRRVGLDEVARLCVTDATAPLAV
jgi:hypothetical protein